MQLKIFQTEIEMNLPLPLFSSSVKAGFPSPAEDHIEEKLDLNRLMIEHPAATFFLRVEGESMENANIYPGDILVVDRALTPHNGLIIVAVLNGEFTVKRLKKKGNRLYLLPENPAFPEVEITTETEFQIWGVVTFIIHKAR
ncbi:LexA family protein [Simkania negevensis]|uniref:Protein samA n=1 Tax=Simkania negevensis (strain ATCC VR-1471 / DSM 27360 / Z) TaxID=331113 RepID=F8L8Q1_SIMNZ|nr:translesion error-prone DNA polymerase V autoproteolytic subunit [Simkania negevensis]CCB89194.1 protein samA [Simkania negevensis Z]